MAIPRDDIGSKLLSLKRELEEQKSQRSELQGELKSLTKQMEMEFGVKTASQAEKLIEKMEKEIEKNEKSIRNRIREIERLMGQRG